MQFQALTKNFNINKTLFLCNESNISLNTNAQIKKYILKMDKILFHLTMMMS